MTESNSVEIALSDFERKRLVEQIYIAFPRLNRVYSLVEHCHQHSKIAAEPECLLITGRQGAGKTTLVQYANTLLKHTAPFDSDYPLIAPDGWLEDFEKIAIRDNVRPLILKENAMRLFGLA